jgi:hypothetical protein
MTQAKVSLEEVQDLAQRFIDVANGLKDQGRSLDAINGALMLASGIYATYSAAGNDGFLKPQGVDKVVEVYRRNLAALQNIKKANTSGSS